MLIMHQGEESYWFSLRKGTLRPSMHTVLTECIPINICIDLTLNTVKSKNILTEQYPDSAICLDKVASTSWRLRTTLYNKLSLEAACSFYLANSDAVDISATPVLKSTVTAYVEKILAQI